MTYPAVPVAFADEKTHRRILAEASNRHNQGKFNCFIEVTLVANAATTKINDLRITATSVLLFMPTTAHAATELATLYVPESTILPPIGTSSGSAVIHHANNSQTDRTFRVGIFG